ncbi:helix-turn-helix domain-containing protein [Companilactobacillus baiquanensis]|uniref:Helix-turn-helix domain-containing protein n=1 Tax=Companilactobacillus baiquanensis TaxID=2486005 RepID=A0ABW1UZE0_9LACO|nr:AraC family transcriptional regulator [Companilactobacillus baiquanensis]
MMDDFSEYFPINEQGKECLRGIYFNNPSNKAKKIFFYPLWGAEYKVSYPYSIDRKYMNSFLIMYIQDGELSITFPDGSNNVAKKDSFIILDCKERNRYFTNTNCHFTFFHFNGNQAQFLYDFITKNGSHIFTANDDIKNDIYEIFNVFRSQIISAREESYSTLIYRFLINLSNSSSVIQIDKSTLHQTPKLVEEALRYIDDHFDEKLTTTNICKYLGVSSSLLAKNFKTYTNNSIHQYIISVRVIHSQRLLTTQPDMSVAEVAATCGFNDTSHLTKIFKSEIGMTPSKFKKMCF